MSIFLENKGSQKYNGDLVTIQMGSGAWNLHLLLDSGICAPSSVSSFYLCLFFFKNQKTELESSQDWESAGRGVRDMMPHS